MVVFEQALSSSHEPSLGHLFHRLDRKDEKISVFHQDFHNVFAFRSQWLQMGIASK